MKTFPLLVFTAVLSSNFTPCYAEPGPATIAEEPVVEQTRPYTDRNLRFEPPITVDEANPCKPYYDISLTKEQRNHEMEKRFLVLVHSKYSDDRTWAAMVNSDLLSTVLKKEIVLQNLRLLLEDSDAEVRRSALAGFGTCTGYSNSFARDALPLFKELWKHPDPETREGIHNLYLFYKSPKEHAYQQGVATAERDIKEDNYGILVLGDETGWRAKWVELVEQEGFEVNPVPTFAADRASCVDGYNKTMRSALTKKYGFDRLGQIESSAKRYLSQEAAGGQKAKADVKKGKYRLIEYGLPAENAPAYWDALAKRYGVIVEPQGCVVTFDEQAYSRGYNDVVRQAIEAKYGKEIFAKTLKEFFPDEDSVKSKATTEGEQAAESDLKTRHFRVYEDISEPKWKPAYVQALNQLGVEVLDWDKTAAEKSSDYCGGYNDVAVEAIKTQFGKYCFDRAKGKAQRQLNASQGR